MKHFYMHAYNKIVDNPMKAPTLNDVNLSLMNNGITIGIEQKEIR